MANLTREYYVYRGGRWVTAAVSNTNGHVAFSDIKFFYANVVDYVRIIMCIVAAFLINTDWYLLCASLVIGSLLLDWIDGPVARAYNQCSLFGSGIDWCADIINTLVVGMWWIRYDHSVTPWMFLACLIELSTGLFDFSTTSTTMYPKLKKGQSGFFIILEWSMPENQYTSFGVFTWLAYPIYCVVRTLEHCYGYDRIIDAADLFTAIQASDYILALFLLNRYCLFLPAVLYIWCELAYGMHIVGSWTEASKKAAPSENEVVYDDATKSVMGGFTYYGTLSAAEQKLLQDIYNDLETKIQVEYKSALSKRKVFWMNIWKRCGKKPGLMIDVKHSTQLDDLIHKWVSKYYDINDVVLDGYGYILNPANSEAQSFHLDYTVAYSTTFIPLTEITHKNSVQYVIPSPSTNSTALSEATKNPDCVDVNIILKDAGYYSVRQCIAKPFSILKMDFGTIHRAISNQESYDRLMFYFSVIKKDVADTVQIPDEPVIQSVGSGC